MDAVTDTSITITLDLGAILVAESMFMLVIAVGMLIKGIRDQRRRDHAEKEEGSEAA